jgi:hypothetical protein
VFFREENGFQERYGVDGVESREPRRLKRSHGWSVLEVNGV